MKNRDFDKWLSTMNDSIATWKYYTDFEKVYKNAEKIKTEIYILNSLINSNYDENFINWIKFIQTLKNSGMSLNDIIEYINLAKCGNNTYQERKNLLIKSKQILLEKMSNLQSMIEKANYQINNYDNILVPKTDVLIF